MPEFVHLHNHSHYSLLDATATPEQLVKAAADDGQKSLALTDHGVMFGVMEFANLAKKEGIKPIIGMEAYIANGSRFDRSSGKRETKKRNYFHLILLVKNETGYRNLIKLASISFLEGFYYRPRIDKGTLEKYSEGLICTSACMGGVVSAHIVRDDIKTARAEAAYYKELFGEDFYIELQNHYFKEDKKILTEAPKIADKLGLKLVATNDIHYMTKDEAVSHNVHLMIKDAKGGGEKQNIEKLRYQTPEFYFKTSEEMAELFKDFPDALTSTVEIAEKCEFEFGNELYMPEFPIPKESKSETLEEYLKELTYKGLNEKFDELTDEIIERTERELGIINSMGFPGYFLIVQDFMRAAERLDVSVGPGRGSAAGSLAAYALGITKVNPLPYDLLFERFLNPERVSMPDIDIDFSDEKRDLVVNYVKEKYGENAVAQIITYGTLSSKAAISDVGRVLGVKYPIVKEITSKIPVVRGKPAKLKDAVKLSDIKKILDGDNPDLKELIKHATALEGRVRNTSTHAAGVVIAPGEVSKYVPLYKSDKEKDQSVEIVTQFSMNELEQAGLLKMDFLGLKTLSIIDNTLEMVERNYGRKIDVDKDIKLDDEKTYDLLSEGDTLAVFQFESEGMQNYLRKLKPRNIEELAAMNALYRPGPMESIPDFIDRKYGRKKIEYLHPVLENALEKTYGIIVYQEQVMQIVRDVAGFSLGQADVLRRAMGKKKKSLMDAQKPDFLKGAAERGFDKKTALAIFDLIAKFAEYGFNKSHSVAYSILAFQTAWLKAYYPAEFLAANMTSELNDQKKIVALIEEAKKLGVEVAPPDVNRSFGKFTVRNNQIYFGMAGVKNVGLAAVDSVVEARKDGDFTSIFDFAARVNTRLVNKRAFEALICSGAFDTIHEGQRARLLNSVDSALDYAKALHNEETANMDSLFGDVEDQDVSEPPLFDGPEWTENEKLNKEKEYLNFYVSGHPVKKYAPYLDSFSSIRLNETDSKFVGDEIVVGGLIVDVRTQTDKRGGKIAFVTIDDAEGKALLIFWSDAFARFEKFLVADEFIFCRGKLKLEENEIRVTASEVMTVDQTLRQSADGYKIFIDLEKTPPEIIANFKSEYCVDSSASSRLIFNVYDKSQKYNAVYEASDVGIKTDFETAGKLFKLFGLNCVRFSRIT